MVVTWWIVAFCVVERHGKRMSITLLSNGSLQLISLGALELCNIDAATTRKVVICGVNWHGSTSTFIIDMRMVSGSACNDL